VPSRATTRLATDALAALRDRLVGLDDPAGSPGAVTAPVVVGCSGGADSTALLALAADRGLAPVAVHVDHGLRAGSGTEHEVVAAHAAAIGVESVGVRVDVDPGGNLEARARDARYAALDAAARAHGATAILVGHTADDQAETVLLALLRGSAAAGLAGMPVRRGGVIRPLVRPLLELRRADTEGLCAALGLAPLHDPSNDDPSYRRAWIRHEVLPFLADGAGRDLVPVLTRQAAVLRTETDYLDALARAAWPIAEPAVEGSTPAATLARLPLALARRSVRCWLASQSSSNGPSSSGGPPASFDEVERVLAVARGEVRATELAGGRRVSRSRGQLFLTWPQ
jgi:tRNA(Ile)-lysidine synthase